MMAHQSSKVIYLEIGKALGSPDYFFQAMMFELQPHSVPSTDRRQSDFTKGPYWGMSPALVHPHLNAPTFKTHCIAHFFLKHIFWRRESIWNNRVGRILLFFSAAVVCISGLVCLGVNYWWYNMTQNAVGLVKVGCTPVQWRLDRQGQPQETKNVSTSDQRSIPSNIF